MGDAYFGFLIAGVLLALVSYMLRGRRLSEAASRRRDDRVLKRAQAAADSLGRRLRIDVALTAERHVLTEETLRYFEVCAAPLELRGCSMDAHPLWTHVILALADVRVLQDHRVSVRRGRVYVGETFRHPPSYGQLRELVILAERSLAAALQVHRRAASVARQRVSGPMEGGAVAALLFLKSFYPATAELAEAVADAEASPWPGLQCAAAVVREDAEAVRAMLLAPRGSGLDAECWLWALRQCDEGDPLLQPAMSHGDARVVDAAAALLGGREGDLMLVDEGEAGELAVADDGGGLSVVATDGAD